MGHCQRLFAKIRSLRDANRRDLTLASLEAGIVDDSLVESSMPVALNRQISRVPLIENMSNDRCTFILTMHLKHF